VRISRSTPALEQIDEAKRGLTVAFLASAARDKIAEAR
jgi:hypothetical protein